MRKAISVILAVIILISFGMVTLAADNESKLSPYAIAYLDDIKHSQNTEETERPDYDQTIRSLNEYYEADCLLSNSINGLVNIDKALITSIKKEDKVGTMHILMRAYCSLEQEQRMLVYEFFKRYAGDSDDESVIEFYQSIKAENRAMLANGTRSFNDNFIPAQAAAWAGNNYNSFDSNFPNMSSMGGDCTNFVSQALYYGGMSMFNNWYCSKKNNTYPEPETSTQLDYSWGLSDPSPWISVGEFPSFWTDYYNDYFEYTKSDYESNHSTYYGEPIYKGDVVILCRQTLWWTTPSHAMIITAYDGANGDFKLTGHTNPRIDYPLLYAISGYASVRIFCL